jgi:hypothetical protein
MGAMAEGAKKLERLTREELAALRQPARLKKPEEKQAAVERATRGLRVAVHVTPSLYRWR